MATSPLIFLSFLLFSSATCFNITKLLGTYPDFSTYNNYLTQTHLASEINSRQTITVLAVSNSAMSSISGKPSDFIKNVMSLHVVLDYYDVSKLQQLSKKTATLTTLFQSSGLATDQQGFLNVTDLTNGNVVFGSAVKGSSLDSKLVKSVAAQPFNISVLQVSSLVIPSGIEKSGHSNSTASPPHSAAPSHAPKKAPTPKSADSPKSAAASSDAPASDGPAADAPVEGKAPASSPPKPAADGPVADGPADGAGAPDASKSSGERVTFGSCAAVVSVIVSSWFAL